MKKDIKALILWASVGMLGALCASCENENEVAIEPAAEVVKHDEIVIGQLSVGMVCRYGINEDGSGYIVSLNRDSLVMERKSVAIIEGLHACGELDAAYDLGYCATCEEYYLGERSSKFNNIEVQYETLRKLN